MSVPPGSPLSPEELAERAGVDPAEIERLVGFGILSSDGDAGFGSADIHRVRLIAACERAGMGADAIALAIADGALSLSFLDLPQYRWAALRDETFGQLAERLELPFDVIQDVGAALGSRRPSAGDQIREDEETIFELIRLASPMVATDALVRISRVYVDGLRRMAAAEAELFDTHLVGGLTRMGFSYVKAMDQASTLLAREMGLMVDRSAADHGGTPIKWLGDGVMVHYRDPEEAARGTLEMVERAPRVGLPAHAGVAAGPVVMQDGDHFGRTVNLASRLASSAGGGQALVSDVVAGLVDAPDLSFTELGPVDLKGFAEPVHVFEAAGSVVRRAPG